MSSLWTPGGERPVGRPEEPAGASAYDAAADDADGREPTEEELRAYAAHLRQQIAEAPAAAFVVQAAVQLFEVASVHMSLQPPQLDEARVAIDAMTALVEGVSGRLGPDEQQLKDGLAQIKLAFVQIKAAADAGGSASGTGATTGESGTGDEDDAGGQDEASGTGGS